MGLLISHTPSFDNVSNVTALIVHLGIVAHSARLLNLHGQ